MTSPKIALVHDYLYQYGGSERTLEAIAELFPEAPVYTSFYNPKKYRGKLDKFRIVTKDGISNKLFGLFPKYLTFLLPLLFESLDLSKYDIVISSSASYAKGVLTNPDQLHISYIHTPPRFLYGYSVESTKRAAWYFKPFVSVIDHFLRIWDFMAAQRPDFIVTNSDAVKKRIHKFYKRTATVIYPPVDVERINTNGFHTAFTKPFEQPYYVAVGRLAAYKNFDLLVQAFNFSSFKLAIVGTGSEEAHLKKMAGPNIKFLGACGDDERNFVTANAQGFLFPIVEEDFGIVPIEAMALGVPVLAHRSGGVLETMREGIDGMFFDSIQVATFLTQLKTFDENIRKGIYNPEKRVNPLDLKEHVGKFSKSRFKQEFKDFVAQRWEEREPKQ